MINTCINIYLIKSINKWTNSVLSIYTFTSCIIAHLECIVVAINDKLGLWLFFFDGAYDIGGRILLHGMHLMHLSILFILKHNFKLGPTKQTHEWRFPQVINYLLIRMLQAWYSFDGSHFSSTPPVQLKFKGAMVAPNLHFNSSIRDLADKHGAEKNNIKESSFGMLG